ncbi:TPR repeat-containing thioredoxin TTL1 [Bienertia sinuspersici]
MSNVSTSPEYKRSGCGYGGRLLEERKGSLPSQNSSAVGSPRRTPSAGHNSKKRRGSFDDLDANANTNTNADTNANVVSSAPSSSRTAPKPQQKVPPVRQNPQPRKSSSNDTTVVPVSKTSTSAQKQNQNTNTKKTVPKQSLGISGELEMMIAEQQQKGRGGANLLRVSSGNVMVNSSLGNLRQPGGPLIRTQNQKNAKYSNTGIGNIVSKKQIEVVAKTTAETSLCRALSCRMDPEELKILGNEDYKNGNFAEALALYERAIDLDPTKASYRSNKSAALTALGRLLEAVFECKEAIVMEPHYHRAHHRLGNLYLRLGEAEKATYHFKQAGPEADPDVMGQAKVVLGHLKKCDDAKRLKDWHTVLKESGNAAYLKLHRPQDAVTTLTNGPNFDVDQCTKFLGPAGNAMVLVIRSQVDMAAGRFDDAMEAIQQASKLDPSNRDVSVVTRRIRAVSTARSHGNDLFKEGRFSEACVAYGQGLEHDPIQLTFALQPSCLSCQAWPVEKALETLLLLCNLAPRILRLDLEELTLQIGEASVRDYEFYCKITGDEDVAKAYFEALMQLKKQHGEDVSNMRFGNDGVIKIQSNEHFKCYIMARPSNRQTLQFFEQLCKRYPAINSSRLRSKITRIGKSRVFAQYSIQNIPKWIKG